MNWHISDQQRDPVNYIVYRRFDIIVLIRIMIPLLGYFKKTCFMGNLLYIVAVILIIGWILGFFAFHVGGIIHALLVIAVVIILIRVIQGKNLG